MDKLQIKAGAVTNLTDARYFAAREADWLGFCLDPADNDYVEPLQVKAIKEWVEGPMIVGEFGMQPVDEIQTLAAQIGLEAIQLGMFATPDQARALQQWTILKEWIIEDVSQLTSLDPELEAFAPFSAAMILNLSKNNIFWEQLSAENVLPVLARYCQSYPIYLDMPLSPHTLSALLPALPLSGLQLKGGAEEKTGYKSFDELDAILDALGHN